MKSSIPIAVAVVASASLAIYWSSSHLRTRLAEQKPNLPSLHDRKETSTEDIEAVLERLRHELGAEDPVASSNGREKRRYFADSVETNLDNNTVNLKGRVWHLDGTMLIDGRADPTSSMTLDASTLKILETSGRLEPTDLIDPKQ